MLWAAGWRITAALAPVWSLVRILGEGLGGLQLEHCAVTDDSRACALEYNILRWGRTELSPEAGIAVYLRGATGRLASARIYDDLEPPLGDMP